MKLKTTIDDTDITVSLETDYPFKNNIKIKVNAAKSSLFSLYLRIPAWANYCFWDASVRHTPPASLLPALVEVLGTDVNAERLPAAFTGCPSLVVVARGPAIAAADYGALILKETAAIAAECLAGGSFRHGPMEIAGPDVGVVVLAPSGPTHELCVRLARDTAALGSPTWLIADDATSLPTTTDRLRVTTLPAVGEAYAPLTMSVPIQRLAARLARGRGREPGVLLRSQKVTDRE
jgi:fructoselysine-6-P-deglycase FrlB-like protein